MGEAVLPGGVFVGGRRYSEATLRPLTGHDEQFLADAARAGVPLPHRATAVLARSLERLGPVSPVPQAAVRELAIGDREALLLQLRRETFGDRLSCVLVCPGCGEKMDLDLQVSCLLLPPYPSWQVEHEVDGVRFRLPNGGDLEALADGPQVTAEEGARAILRRCSGGDLDASTSVRVAERMAEADPQAEVLLGAACPECGHAFEGLLDAASHLLREAAGGQGQLDREVHALAYHYHWSPGDILGLTRSRRRVFLELLDEQLDAEGRA